MKYPLPLFVGLMVCSPTFSQSNDSARFYFQKGIQEKNVRHLLQASRYFDKAIQFDPKYTEALLENAYANLEMRKLDNAKAEFTRVNELDPNNLSAIKELTELYFNYRQFSKAIEFAMKCAGCSNVERIIAMCNFEQEDYGKAIKGLLNVLTKSPNDAEATYTLAKSYLEIDDYQNAIPYYNKAINLDLTKSAWMFELGFLYYNQNDYKNAVVFFEKAAQSGYPQSNDFNENLGYAYIYSGQFDKGEKVLLAILERKPGNKELMRDMAEAYYSQKMYDKSLEYCQKLMELDAKDGKALYQAGMCFQKKGNKAKGEGMCDKAIELDPSLNSLRQKQMSAGL